MTTATKVTHPYNPPHMTRTSFGNVAACCGRPEADHPAFIDGTETRVVLTRDIRHLNGKVTRKGYVMTATRSNGKDCMQEVRPSRWGTNTLGQFAELDKGERIMVNSPGWTIRLDGDTHLTGIPWKWAKETGA